MKLIRIFIGSPGGLDEERKAARDVFEEVNLAHGEQWRVHFKIIAWEDTIPGYQRVQSKINEDLDRCQYFIGVLHNRWGTPPSNDQNGYSSGFEEEYYRAVKAIKSGKMKDMALFFKKIQEHDGFVPDSETEKVITFRNEQVVGKVNYFRDYDTLEKFKNEIRCKLNEIGWRESGLDAINQEDQASHPGANLTENVDPDRDNKSTLFETESRDFISDLLNKTNDWEATQPFEVARLRLIAASFSRSGNDEINLGNHDANLIFMHLRNKPLSEQEYASLIDSGVAGFHHCNVPLWHWLARKKVHEHFPYYRLRLLATVGSKDEQYNAIRVLQILNEPIPTHGTYFNTHRVLEMWFSENAKDRVFEAAVSFLAENAKMDDLPSIEKALGIAPANRKNKIEGAIVSIIAKHSIDDALKRVREHDVDMLDTKIIQDLFSSPSSLETKTLVDCLSARSEDVRVSAARVLYNRNEISNAIANSLLTDSNHEIRLVAVETLHQQGNPLDDELVKKVLTIERARTTSGLFANGKKETDTTVYDEYRRNRLFELTEFDLRKEMENKLIYKKRELEVLYTKFGSKKHVLAELRQHLEDGFKTHFEHELEQAEIKHQNLRNYHDIKSSLVQFYRTQLCSVALSALCDIRRSEDLSLVRQTLDQFSVNGSKNILSYLARFGDWTDIARVNNLEENSNKNSTLLTLGTISYPSERALAIFALGKHRLADLLLCDMQSLVRHELLQLVPQKNISELSDDLILRELSSKDDKSRIIFALRCVQSLPRARIKNILQKYLEGEEYSFYNSIHWLDLGASFPKRQAKYIATRELARRCF